MHEPNSMLSRRDLLCAGAAAAGTWMTVGDSASAEKPQDDSGGEYIDAHVHVWTPDTQRYPLAPGYTKERMAVASFTPEELFAVARPCGVRRIVLIQMSYYLWDNSYMLDMMRKHQGVFSGVARVEEVGDPRGKMRELARQGVRGFRIVSGNEGVDRWLSGEPMHAMWRCGADEGLAISTLINPQFLPALNAMCQKYPKTPVVVDHFARIGMDGTIRSQDLDNLCALARHKSVRVKISAFYALGKKKAPYLDLAPMIRRLLDAFGPERLMWASDSPFQTLGGHSYRESIELIRSGLDFLTANDRDWLLRRTAEKMFFA